ncbi:unnamed protein product, partial [Iphiclides podalirius]
MQRLVKLICLFAIVRSAHSQSCSPSIITVNVENGDLLLDKTQVCSCFKPKNETGGDTCDYGIRELEGKLHISLKVLCAEACVRGRDNKSIEIISDGKRDPTKPTPGELLDKENGTEPNPLPPITMGDEKTGGNDSLTSISSLGSSPTGKVREDEIKNKNDTKKSGEDAPKNATESTPKLTDDKKNVNVTKTSGEEATERDAESNPKLTDDKKNVNVTKTSGGEPTERATESTPKLTDDKKNVNVTTTSGEEATERGTENIPKLADDKKNVNVTKKSGEEATERATESTSGEGEIQKQKLGAENGSTGYTTGSVVLFFFCGLLVGVFLIFATKYAYSKYKAAEYDVERRPA